MLLWQKRWVKSKGEDENEEDLISMQRRNVNQYAGGKNEESSTEKVKAFAYTCNICSEIYFCRQYLNMKKWQILPLYWYRSVLYGLKMLRYQDFRKYVGEYVKRTGLELKKIL